MRVVALVTAFALTSCSFVFTRGPAQVPLTQKAAPYPPDCTTSMAFPLFDGILGAIGWLAVADAVSNSEMEQKADSIVGAVIFAGLFTAGAFVGYSRVSRCRDARERFMAVYPYGYQPQQPQQPYYGQPQPQPQPPAQPQPPVEPAPPAPRPPTKPTNPLGTEGDVCNSISDCAAGLLCQQNVCMRPKQ